LRLSLWLASDLGPKPGYGAYAPNLAEFAELPGIAFPAAFEATRVSTERSGQAPSSGSNPAGAGRWFHPAESEAEQWFAMAWTSFYATGRFECDSAPLGVLQYLEVQAASVTEPRFARAFQAMLRLMQGCALRPNRNAIYVAPRLEYGRVTLETAATQRQLSGSAVLYWSPELEETAGRLGVQAIDPAQRLRASGAIDTTQLQIPPAPFQRFLTHRDANETLTAAATMERAVLFVPAPRNEAEARDILERQYLLALAHVEQRAPVVRIDLLYENSAIGSLLPRSATGVLVDQGALSRARIQAEQAAH
jgi:hypothetical protein